MRVHFKHFTEEQRDLCVREGYTLRGRLVRDKHASLTGAQKISFGKVYYSMLKALYGTVGAGELRSLGITNGDEACGPDVAKAMEGVYTKRKSFKALFHFLETGPKVSRRTFVGLMTCEVRHLGHQGDEAHHSKGRKPHGGSRPFQGRSF